MTKFILSMVKSGCASEPIQPSKAAAQATVWRAGGRVRLPDSQPIRRSCSYSTTWLSLVSLPESSEDMRRPEQSGGHREAVIQHLRGERCLVTRYAAGQVRQFVVSVVHRARAMNLSVPWVAERCRLDRLLPGQEHAACPRLRRAAYRGPSLRRRSAMPCRRQGWARDRTTATVAVLTPRALARPAARRWLMQARPRR